MGQIAETPQAAKPAETAEISLLQQILEEARQTDRANDNLRRSLIDRLASEAAGIAEFERRAEMIGQLRILSIRQTHPKDWVLHRLPDGSTLGIPSAAACQKFAPLWGIELKNIRPTTPDGRFAPEKIPGEKEFSYRAWCDARCNATDAALESLEATRGSGEDFTGRSENESDLRLSVYTLLMSKAARIFSGLSRVPGEVLDAAWKGTERATGQCTRGHGFGSSTERAAQKVADPGVKEKADALWADILRVTGGDADAAKGILRSVTSFTGKDGKKFDGYESADRITSEKMLAMARSRFEKQYEQGDAQ